MRKMRKTTNRNVIRTKKMMTRTRAIRSELKHASITDSETAVAGKWFVGHMGFSRHPFSGLQVQRVLSSWRINLEQWILP